MEYRIKRDIVNDKEGYDILYNTLNRKLKEVDAPTKCNREFKTNAGLISLEPFPYKGNAEAIKKIQKIPGFVRVKRSRDNVDGKISSTVLIVFSGLAMLDGLKEPKDTIVFYDEDCSVPENQEVSELLK